MQSQALHLLCTLSFHCLKKILAALTKSAIMTEMHVLINSVCEICPFTLGAKGIREPQQLE